MEVRKKKGKGDSWELALLPVFSSPQGKGQATEHKGGVLRGGLGLGSRGGKGGEFILLRGKVPLYLKKSLSEPEAKDDGPKKNKLKRPPQKREEGSRLAAGDKSSNRQSYWGSAFWETAKCE